MTRDRIRHAFTMVELVMVIAVLGIVSSIGASIVAQVYDSYVTERALYRANIKTELALTQIANRLRYAIPETMGVRASTAAGVPFIKLTENATDQNDVFQWVSYDGDSFEAVTSAADRRPGWSGFVDLNSPNTNKDKLSTQGSNLNLAYTIISNLSGGTKTLSDAELYFPDSNGSSTGVDNLDATTLTLDNNATTIYERYKLAWSSYALVKDANGDLRLYYNFAPVLGAAIPTPTATNNQILLRHIDSLRFRGTEGALRVKLCVEENLTQTSAVHSCKEKVIF